MDTFFTRFEPLLAAAFHAHGTDTGRSCSWDELATQVHELAERERHLPLPPDMTPQSMEDCRLAVYTFVDETLLDSPRSMTAAKATASMGWYASSLQNRYLGNTNGGEFFYQRLEAVLNAMPQGQEAVLPQGMGTPSPADPLSTLTLLKIHPPLPQKQPALVRQWENLLTRWREGGLPTAPAPALAHILTLSVFAQCLAYGFQGKLHDAKHHDERIALQQLACSTLLLCMDEAVPTQQGTIFADHKIKKENRQIDDTPRVPTPKSVFKEYELFLYVLAPLVITLLWYLLCADLVAGISLTPLI